MGVLCVGGVWECKLCEGGVWGCCVRVLCGGAV